MALSLRAELHKRIERLEARTGEGSRLVILSGEDAAERLERWKAGESVEGIRGVYRGGPLLVVFE